MAEAEGSAAQRHAVEASSSYKATSEQLSDTQEAAAEAANTAATEISDLQVGLPYMDVSVIHLHAELRMHATWSRHVGHSLLVQISLAFAKL